MLFITGMLVSSDINSIQLAHCFPVILLSFSSTEYARIHQQIALKPFLKCMYYLSNISWGKTTTKKNKSANRCQITLRLFSTTWESFHRLCFCCDNRLSFVLSGWSFTMAEDGIGYGHLAKTDCFLSLSCCYMAHSLSHTHTHTHTHTQLMKGNKNGATHEEKHSHMHKIKVTTYDHNLSTQQSRLTVWYIKIYEEWKYKMVYKRI